MKNKREIDQATATNPQSRGGLLPLHHGDDAGDVGGDGDIYNSKIHEVKIFIIDTNLTNTHNQMLQFLQIKLRPNIFYLLYIK